MRIQRLIFCLLLWRLGGSQGKVIRGKLRSSAQLFSEIYLGQFTFDKTGGRILVKTKTRVRGQRFLFFDGSIESWPHILAHYQELSCMGLRNVSLMVTEDEQDDSLSEGLNVPLGSYQADLNLSPTDQPAQWYTMLSNCDDVVDLQFSLTFLNSGGWWYQQFSVDEQGLLEMFVGWTIMYTIIIFFSFFAYVRVREPQPLHPVEMLLAAALLFQYISVFFETLHGLQYADDGEGRKALQGLGEVAGSLSNIIIMTLLLLMAKGWTTTSFGSSPRAPVNISSQWKTGTAVSMCGFFSLFVLERIGRAIDERFCYDSDLGVFLLVLRTAVYGYFLLCLFRSLRIEEQPQRKHNLLVFGAISSVWFLAVPLAYVLAQFLNSWDQMKFIIATQSLVHTLGLIALEVVLWPRMRAMKYVIVNTPELTSDNWMANTPYDEI